MLKRKQTELKASSLPLSLHKWSLTNIRASAVTHWKIESIQPFFPSLEVLFKTNDVEIVGDYGIRLDEEITGILSADSIRTSKFEKRSVHCKTSMILSPFKWMQGEYGSTVGLPSSSGQSSEISSKIQSHHNAVYVGSLISAILSQSKCQHFPKVYGIFSGLSKNHTIDISDDYEDLSERSWFSSNIGKTFDLKLSDGVRDAIEFQHTRTSRPRLNLGEQITLDGVEDLDAEHIGDTEVADLQQLLEESDDEDNESDSSSVSTSYIFKVESCDCEEDEEEDTNSIEESVDPFAWASFTNVPVQTTVMEKCEGTLYKLMIENTQTEKHLAWVSQVMFALAFAQRNFGITHNDLHSNNVMYVSTSQEFLYYNCNGSYYKVPTFGYLIKIIDFERGITSIRLPGMKESKTFMSDHFSVNEEAGGQYNSEPFYNNKFNSVKPNPSFDLIRIATSMFWDLFPEGPNHEDYKMNTLFNFFTRWLKQDDGSSVMFGKKDPRHDRYHGFHLYKAIARYSRDSAIPRREIEYLKPIYGLDSLVGVADILTID